MTCIHQDRQANKGKQRQPRTKSKQQSQSTKPAESNKTREEKDERKKERWKEKKKSPQEPEPARAETSTGSQTPTQPTRSYTSRRAYHLKAAQSILVPIPIQIQSESHWPRRRADSIWSQTPAAAHQAQLADWRLPGPNPDPAYLQKTASCEAVCEESAQPDRIG